MLFCCHHYFNFLSLWRIFSWMHINILYICDLWSECNGLDLAHIVVCAVLLDNSMGAMSFLTGTSSEVPAKSAFLNKESVQKEVKATLSQKATLSCEVADTKTEVKWFKDGKLLTSSRTIHTESRGKSRQMVIDSVEKKDAGEYICEVGSEKLIFKIQVAGRMGRNLLPYSTVFANVKFTFICHINCLF